MKVSDFDYNLPPDRIAQHPLPQRDQSRLLVLRREDHTIEDAAFKDLPGYLADGDLVVVNDVRVAPFRLAGKKATGGKAELTLVRPLDEPGQWECLIKARNPRAGMKIELDGGAVAEIVGESGGEVRVEADKGAPLWRVTIAADDVDSLLSSRGLPPLPPYIKRPAGADPAEDRERYQTVYAKDGRAAAAPTAGLHFTGALLGEIEERGVGIARARLEVGYGTFAPIRTEEVEDHRMHVEQYELSDQTAEAVARTRTDGGRVVAVGTTTVRVLESRADDEGSLKPGSGETGAFIYPGYRFKTVDAMVTNFHMPRSTLILLVAAFAGREFTLEAYHHALEQGYRFLSYGDAMLIL